MRKYIIVIIPPKKIQEYIKNFRIKFSKQKTYKISPHITICSPFTISGFSEKSLVGALKKTMSDITPFVCTSKSIGYFENGKNKVVYFKPDKTSILKMEEIYNKITKVLKGGIKNVFTGPDFRGDKFNPHMTIVEEIPLPEIPLIREALRASSIKLSFYVSSVFIYTKDDGRIWEKLTEVKFTS